MKKRDTDAKFNSWSTRRSTAALTGKNSERAEIQMKNSGFEKSLSSFSTTPQASAKKSVGFADTKSTSNPLFQGSDGFDEVSNILKEHVRSPSNTKVGNGWAKNGDDEDFDLHHDISF